MENNETPTLEFGIEWTTEPVQKQAGDHATDRRVIGMAQIPVVRDLDAFAKEFGAECVLGILDGTSVRVMAQDVNRRGLSKGGNDAKPEILRAAVINRLRGVRNSGSRTVKTVKVYTLPNGETYTGTDETEYQQLYIAALVDAGTPASVATTIGALQKLA